MARGVALPTCSPPLTDYRLIVLIQWKYCLAFSGHARTRWLFPFPPDPHRTGRLNFIEVLSRIIDPETVAGPSLCLMSSTGWICQSCNLTLFGSLWLSTVAEWRSCSELTSGRMQVIMIGLGLINACKSHEAPDLFIIFYLTLDVRVHQQKKSFCSIWSKIKHPSQMAGTLLLVPREHQF